MAGIFLNGKTLDKLRFRYDSKDYAFQKEEIKPNKDVWLYFYRKDRVTKSLDESDGILVITNCKGYYGTISISKHGEQTRWAAIEPRLEVLPSKSAEIAVGKLEAKLKKKPEEE